MCLQVSRAAAAFFSASFCYFLRSFPLTHTHTRTHAHTHTHTHTHTASTMYSDYINVSVCSFSHCTHRAPYADGKMLPSKPGGVAEPRPCAGNQGTQISAEDLFYNMPTRKRALKASEEYTRIADAITKLEYHTPSSLSLRFVLPVRNYYCHRALESWNINGNYKIFKHTNHNCARYR